MTYTLAITSTFPDGHETTWHYYRDGGMTAQEAHDELAKRWKAAGYEFTRDRANRTLTRHITDESRGGPYIDTIRHEETP